MLPKSLVVVGSGAVGVEFASIFKSFGADVTILETLPRMVPAEDEDISKELLRLFKKRGIDVNLSAKGRQDRKEQGRRARSLYKGRRHSRYQAGGEGAGRRRPCAANLRCWPRQGEHHAGSRLYRDQRMDGDDRTGHLRDRRHRCGPAAVGARRQHGWPGCCGAAWLASTPRP